MVGRKYPSESTLDPDKRGVVEQLEVGRAPYPPGVTFGQKAKRHCARFWWLHLIVFCIVFLIVALCLVYVAFPRIAQSGVDETSLVFNDLEFLNPTPDSLQLTQNSTLYSPSTFTPTLDPFDADVYIVQDGTVGATPFLSIPMPSIHALHPQSEIDFTGKAAQILSSQGLGDFATQVLSQENVTSAFVGKTSLHLGAMPVVSVNYKSQSTFKGLNGLAGFNVSGVKINLTATPGQPNMQGFAYIPNPSIMTIAMGNVTLSLATEKSGIVGNTTILDMTLVPGNNTLPMIGTLNQTLILASVNSSGFVQMTITGQSAIYNGNHLPYYETALANNKLSLAMNVQQIIIDSTKL